MQNSKQEAEEWCLKLYNIIILYLMDVLRWWVLKIRRFGKKVKRQKGKKGRQHDSRRRSDCLLFRFQEAEYQRSLTVEHNSCKEMIEFYEMHTLNVKNIQLKCPKFKISISILNFWLLVLLRVSTSQESLQEQDEKARTRWNKQEGQTTTNFISSSEHYLQGSKLDLELNRRWVKLWLAKVVLTLLRKENLTYKIILRVRFIFNNFLASLCL